VKKIQLILASSSPQRLILLKTIGVIPDKIVPSNIDEIPEKNEKPRDFVLRMSKEKALDVSKNFPNSFILSGDTIVACGRRIIGKPSDRDNAKQILSLLSGRRHQVLSAITLIKPDKNEVSKIVITRVKFSRLNQNALNAYLDTNEWKGKAGGYAIQGSASSFIPWINGSYSSVMGFPMNEVNNLLNSSGWKNQNE
tara:strand:+ start:15 stop:602 length:588 start_codon:yes stop_codon:yes gene_type:complete